MAGCPMMMRLGAVIACAAVAYPQTAAVSSDAVLASAREVAGKRIGNLPKYTCTALIDRTYLRVTRGEAATCDKILGNRHRGIFGAKKTATDRLRLDVEVADSGTEIFSWPGAAKFDVARVEDMANGGPIGTGSFGSFVINLFTTPGAQFVYQGVAQIGGRATFEYRFRVPLEASHYKVGAGASYRFVEYEGRVWIDPSSGELVRLEVRTGELPLATGACEATTRVDLRVLHIGEGEYLAPKQSVLDVVGRYGRDSESVTVYSACHEFRGESTVQFGEVTDASQPGAVVAPGLEQSLPAGLPVELTFESAIDTDITAAGDPLVARVLKPVVDRVSRKTLLAAGTSVNGRVVHMEHNLIGKDDFILSVVFDTPHLIPNHPGRIAWVGKTTRCWESRRLVHTFSGFWRSRQEVESQGQLTLGGSFLLPSHNGRYVMPKGCVSEWLTAQ
jgi:hypothetical protein